MRSLRKTLIIKINPDAPARDKISAAAKVLREGGLVAFPTETVYGLAANLKRKSAVARLCKVKNRLRNKPFTVHISDIGMIKKMGCALTKDAKALIKKFWPGPLTIILKAKNGSNIGFRMPDNKAALELIRESGVPVIAPSANLSGRRPPVTAADVLDDLDGRIDALLDAGPAKVGIESTVVDLTARDPKILREGAIKSEKVLKAIAR